MMRSCRSGGKNSEVKLDFIFLSYYRLGSYLWISSRRVTYPELPFTVIPLSLLNNVLEGD